MGKNILSLVLMGIMVWSSMLFIGCNRNDGDIADLSQNPFWVVVSTFFPYVLLLAFAIFLIIIVVKTGMHQRKKGKEEDEGSND